MTLSMLLVSTVTVSTTADLELLLSQIDFIAQFYMKISLSLEGRHYASIALIDETELSSNPIEPLILK